MRPLTRFYFLKISVKRSAFRFVFAPQAFYTSPLHGAKSTPSLVDSAGSPSPEGSLKNKWMNSVDSLDTVSSAASSSAAGPNNNKQGEANHVTSEFGKLK